MQVRGVINLLISGGFQAPTGAEPPLEKFKPPPGKIPEYASELRAISSFKSPFLLSQHSRVT